MTDTDALLKIQERIAALSVERLHEEQKEEWLRFRFRDLEIQLEEHGGRSDAPEPVRLRFDVAFLEIARANARVTDLGALLRVEYGRFIRLFGATAPGRTLAPKLRVVAVADQLPTKVL